MAFRKALAVPFVLALAAATTPTSTEGSDWSAKALAADDACAANDGEPCAAELLQRRSAKVEGHRFTDAASSADGEAAKALAPALVEEVFTFGGPATHTPPFRNNAAPDGCFKGLRSYTEDLLGLASNPIHEVDAAAMFTRYSHMMVNTVVLRYGADSIYAPCNGSLTGHPDWPLRGAQVYDAWTLHQEDDYNSRLESITLNGKAVSNQEPFKTGSLYAQLAWRMYDKLPEARARIKKLHPDIRLVGLFVQRNLGDDDPVAVIQDEKTLGCAVLFAGTNSFAEMFTSMTEYGTGYCGFKDVHVGFRNELWTLTSHEWSEYVKPRLAKCSRVQCVGHSLGGALCEVFAACANSGHVGDADYERLAWKPESPELMPEDNWYTTSADDPKV